MKHFQLDIAGEKVPVGAARLKFASLRQGDGADSRHEDVVVKGVEIYLSAAHFLLAERHDDKANLGVVHRPSPYLAITLVLGPPVHPSTAPGLTNDRQKSGGLSFTAIAIGPSQIGPSQVPRRRCREGAVPLNMSVRTAPQSPPPRPEPESLRSHRSRPSRPPPTPPPPRAGACHRRPGRAPAPRGR